MDLKRKRRFLTAFSLQIFYFVSAVGLQFAFGAELKVPEEYPDIQSAVDASIDGDVIKICNGKYIGDLSLLEPKIIAILGGWDATYVNNEGVTTVMGPLTLSDGTLVVNDLALAGRKNEPSLVLMTAAGTEKIKMAWIPGSDGDTSDDQIQYKIYLGASEQFVPSDSTLVKTVMGASQAEISGLQSNTEYFGKVIAVYPTTTSDPSNSLRTRTHKQPAQLDPTATVQNASEPDLKGNDTRSGVTFLGLGPHNTLDGITYTYSGGTPPDVGSILFSEDVDGGITIRRVDSSSISGGIVTVVTSDAWLTDALDVGAIDSSFQLFDIHETAERVRSAGMSKSTIVEQRVRYDGSQYSRIDWRNGLLTAEQITYTYDEGDMRVTTDGKTSTVELFYNLRDVSSSFTADVKAEFEPELITETEWGGVIVKNLESGKVAAKGTLTLEADAEFNFSASGSIGNDFTLFSKTWTSVYSAGPVPVYQEIVLTMDVETSASAEAKIKAGAYAMFTETVEIGATYDGEDWTPYIENQEKKELTASLDILGKASAEIRLIPQIEVKFYKLVGASLSVEPYIESELTFEETTTNIHFLAAHPSRLVQLASFDTGLGMDANIAVTLSALDYSWDILPRTCVLGTGECLYSFDELELFSIPTLALSASEFAGVGLQLQLQASDGTLNTFKSGSVNWEVFPEDASLQPGYCGKNGNITTCTAILVPGAENLYTVFASGHGILGEMGRQFKEIEVSPSQYSGLVAYYPFNGNANDESGNGNNGTIYGATLTPDKDGNIDSAFYFNGVDSYIEMPDDDSLDLTNTFTISTWVNQYSVGEDGYAIVNKTTPGVNDGYLFDTHANSNWRTMRLCGGACNSAADLSHSIGQWHNLTVVFNNGISTFYLDGTFAGSGDHCGSTAVQTNNLTMRIGTQRGGYMSTTTFHGAIDEVRIYNRVLSENEIQQLIN